MSVKYCESEAGVDQLIREGSHWRALYRLGRNGLMTALY